MGADPAAHVRTGWGRYPTPFAARISSWKAGNECLGQVPRAQISTKQPEGWRMPFPCMLCDACARTERVEKADRSATWREEGGSLHLWRTSQSTA